MNRIFTRSTVVFLLAMAMFASTAGAQEAAAKAPGYVEFDAKSLFGGAAPKVEVNLPKALLRVAAAAVQLDQPEFSAVLNSLDVIRVQVYEQDGVAPQVETTAPVEVDTTAFDTALAGLRQDPAWMQTVKVQEGQADESVNGFVKVGDDGHVQGLAVIVNDLPKTLVFVNIVGNIEPESLGKVLAYAMQGHVDVTEFRNLFGQGIAGIVPPGPPSAPSAPEPATEAEPAAAP